MQDGSLATTDSCQHRTIKVGAGDDTAEPNPAGLDESGTISGVDIILSDENFTGPSGKTSFCKVTLRSFAVLSQPLSVSVSDQFSGDTDPNDLI